MRVKHHTSYREFLVGVAKNCNIYITQDKDEFVAAWRVKPKRNLAEGYWEADGEESILLEPIFKPYATNWKTSLITPRSTR